MADEKKLLPVIGLDQAGIIKDVPGHILPQPAFTDGKNVFFKNSSVQKRKGTVKAVDDISNVVATLVSTAGNLMTFDVDPALTVNSEFTIANATPSNFNGTYNVTAVSETGKTIEVSQTLTAYTSGGTYTFTPKIDFVDYWPAPNNPQYIEVQQNDAATPAAPIFNSIRASGVRERISLKSYEIEAINQSTTPTITLDEDPFNLTNYDVNGTLVVKPAVEREIKAGETLKIFGTNPSGYDGNYVVTSITYNTGTNKTEISCSSASVDTSALALYTTDSGDLRRDTFSPTSYLGITSQDWQSAFFAGGYAYIINDGYHTPHYLLASLGSNYETPQLTPLPGWDWQRYLGEEVHVSCKVIRGFKDTLIAGNLNLYPITAGVPSLNPSNSKPGTIRISRTAAPGEIPTSWQPALTEAFVEERELSTTSEIIDIVPLQGSAIVYTTDSIHSIKYDSRGNVFDEIIAEGYGALETGCVLEFDGKHVVIGSDDIYMFGGHPGSIKSICDGKMRDYFYGNLSPTPAYLDNIFMVRDTSLDEIHIYYPTKLSPNGFCDEYLAWNYRNNTWTINECNNLVSGFLGPVRGGGVAGGSVTFAGVGNTTASARPDQQSITVDLDADYTVVGSNEVQTLNYSTSNTAVASTYEEEKLNITIPSEIIPFNEEIVEFDFNNAFDTGASSRDIGTQTGSGATTNIDSTGINLNVTPNDYVAINTTFSKSTGWGLVDTFSYGDVVFTYDGGTIAGTITLNSGTTVNLKTAVTVDNSSPVSGVLKADEAGYYLIYFRTVPSSVVAQTVLLFHADVNDTFNWLASGTANNLGGVTLSNSYSPSEIGTAFSGTTNVDDRNTQRGVYSLSGIPSGADIEIDIQGSLDPSSITLTEIDTSHEFKDNPSNFDQNRSWSMTGTVPTQTHASTTNADGTLVTGSGTTSPTNISGFTGFNLTEQEFSAPAKTDSGSGSYPRTIPQDGGDGTIARSVLVNQTVYPTVNTTVNNGDTFTIAYTVSGFPIATVSSASGRITLGGRSFSLGVGSNISSNTFNATFNVTIAGVQYTNIPYSNFGGSSSATWAGGPVPIYSAGYTTYSFGAVQTVGTDWTDNAATLNSSTGLVTFPAQYKTTYTLTNGSSTTIDNVDFTVGSKSVNASPFAPGDSPLKHSFSDQGSARSWSVNLGSAATFALAGDGAFPDLNTRSFPANVGAATAVSYAAGIIDSSSTAVKAQAKAADNTILQVFYFNSDLSGTNTNITLTLDPQDGSNVTADGSATSTGTRTAQGQFFTQYRVVIDNNNNDEVINITPTFNSTNIDLTGAQNTFAAEVGEYLRDEIISAVNASGFMTSEPDWYDDGSSGAAGSDYVIRIGTQDIENYSVTLTNINTTNGSYPGATSGANNTFVFSDTLGSDSSTTPDTVVVKNPYNNTMSSLTTRSGETIESVMNRVAAAIQADTNDGWSASHNAGNDTITFTATAPGRYPIGTGAPADLVYTDYAVIAFDYTQGTNVLLQGSIPDINASITTQGADESVKLTIVDPSRDNVALDGPYEDTFEVGGATNEDIANSIKNRIDGFWVNWTAAVTDTGVAATSPATGNQWKVTLTSTTNDWILKDRTSSDITVNDVSYPTDRAIYVKKVEYGTSVTGDASSATAGTNFDANTGASGNFIPADVQIGHPIISPTTITVQVQYATSTINQDVVLNSAGNADSMATGVANIFNSSAVPALSASSSGSVLTITTNDLTQQINNITFTFDEQTTQGNRNSVSRTNGNNIAGSGGTPVTTLALNTVTDADRPYPTSSFNLNKFYPIVANQTSILCEDIGYAFNADPPNNTDGTAYTSYVERIQLPIDNSVEYKKAISYIQLLVENGNVKVKISGTDAPGKETNLYVDHNGDVVGLKEFDYDDDYKIDFRSNGRLINYYIEDGSDYLLTNSEYKGWRVSGVGFKVEPTESRGKR